MPDWSCFYIYRKMCHSTSGYTIDVHIRAFLCSSKAYVIVQVVTYVTRMSLELNEVDKRSA